MSDNSSGISKLLRRKVIMGATVAAALVFMLVGVILWGGFNTAMEATNTLDFCISCHEMEENVYQEYKTTIHFTNRSGVRAACSDCHVPRDWTHKVVRKIQASGEVFHKIMGSVDTPEKFNEKRLTLAKRVWHTMKSTDSRECRNCHDFGTMNPENQKPRARKQHYNAMQRGQTCIDCHKGIAHKKINQELTDEELEKLEAPDPSIKREIAPQWVAFFEGGGEQSQTDAGTEEAPAASEEAPAPAAAPEAAAPEASQEPATVASAEPAPAAAATPAEATPAAAGNGGGVDKGIDWNKASSTEVGVFYPGLASMEWVLNGRDHGGARPLKAGDRCFDCHAEEIADIGKKIVTGKKLEPKPIPGKRGSIPVTVQATHDNDYLYLRFLWKDGPHAPVPFANGGKMDPKNASKIAMMLATDDVEYVDRAGCWATCHHDLNAMPDAPSKDLIEANPAKGHYNWDGAISKYIEESRTSIEISGKDGSPRGGWDKLKREDEIKAVFDAGQYLDIMRYKINEGITEDGYVLADRHMQGGGAAQFSGGLKDGTWTVVLKRKLKGDKPGDLSLAADQLYNVGFAIHDDYSLGRYHHVSLGYKLGFDNEEAEINATAQ